MLCNGFCRVASEFEGVLILWGNMKNSYDRLQVLQPSGNGPARLSCGLWQKELGRRSGRRRECDG
jgi:hypothetical protein